MPSPPARAAFRAAAEDALTRVPCWGEGAVYRAVASLQRAFFDPPTEYRAHWDIGQELAQGSKLKAAPAIEHGGDLPSRPLSQACTIGARHVLVLCPSRATA